MDVFHIARPKCLCIREIIMKCRGALCGKSCLGNKRKPCTLLFWSLFECNGWWSFCPLVLFAFPKLQSQSCFFVPGGQCHRFMPLVTELSGRPFSQAFEDGHNTRLAAVFCAVSVFFFVMCHPGRWESSCLISENTLCQFRYLAATIAVSRRQLKNVGLRRGHSEGWARMVAADTEPPAVTSLKQKLCNVPYLTVDWCY
jgi:hypothetical protein